VRTMSESALERSASSKRTLAPPTRFLPSRALPPSQLRGTSKGMAVAKLRTTTTTQTEWCRPASGLGWRDPRACMVVGVVHLVIPTEKPFRARPPFLLWHLPGRAAEREVVLTSWSRRVGADRQATSHLPSLLLAILPAHDLLIVARLCSCTVLNSARLLGANRGTFLLTCWEALLNICWTWSRQQRSFVNGATAVGFGEMSSTPPPRHFLADRRSIRSKQSSPARRDLDLGRCWAACVLGGRVGA
jgi:hypothetical protein